MHFCGLRSAQLAKDPQHKKLDAQFSNSTAALTILLIQLQICLFKFTKAVFQN